uniref:Serine-threonine kinase receptor-associated protein n=1 Tax=Polytomella parva TaxID=51329 RepID=A0A7S0YN19_9CHLO|mmetsp:Transcript_34192/g.61662  ORF Transcript_34192/g.61662 Transcript_34192/m.61662 type:complete len:332 (+) Transcript_34192:140-1135(+)|eukprot:CAMPEP_0175077080 /NCGR_PEP_ID=MMETSP0052_2-20121109/23156_1 /TAXON_ID=51329 ORGANISM="Polytomella parva, Strain SAG 63-3" /NCGR_SAMPLE_ID=MMETSP0052_2 /ASSEMBLY_ACC=CAM_ASM_000194 /LENGTH=331 /DNA_ID=CAMNT_0016346435 /DNA_START=84 /DNA_END=1079 /DNA_ORIENTATION=-
MSIIPRSASSIVCHGHSRPIVDLNFSNLTPDGYFLASASKDGKPMLRYGENGNWYGTFEGHKGACWSCVLDGTALKCATGSADFTAKIWDACTGQLLYDFVHNHIVRSVNFSSDNSKLVTGGAEKAARIFDLNHLGSAPVQFPLAASGIHNVHFLKNDSLIACSFVDKQGLLLYDVRTTKAVRVIESTAPLTSVEVSYDKRFLTTAEGETVRLFDADTLECFRTINLRHKAESASYCAAKQHLAVGGEDMWPRVFDLNSMEELICNKGHHGPVHSIRWAPTYDAFATGSEDGTIRIWSAVSDGGQHPLSHPSDPTGRTTTNATLPSLISAA